jgi:hypothetical protein
MQVVVKPKPQMCEAVVTGKRSAPSGPGCVQLLHDSGPVIRLSMPQAHVRCVLQRRLGTYEKHSTQSRDKIDTTLAS